MTTPPDAILIRMTHDRSFAAAPAGTNKCAQTIGGKPHHSDLIHRLFAPDDPGPMVQLMTYCGRRADRLVPEGEGKEIDCPECLDEGGATHS